MNAINSCKNCGHNDIPLRSCVGCQRVRYCSRECQRADWPIHQAGCISSEIELLFERRLTLFEETEFQPLVPETVVATGRLVRLSSDETSIILLNGYPKHPDLTPQPSFVNVNGTKWVSVDNQNTLKHWMLTLVPMQLWRDGFDLSNQTAVGGFIMCNSDLFLLVLIFLHCFSIAPPFQMV